MLQPFFVLLIPCLHCLQPLSFVNTSVKVLPTPLQSLDNFPLETVNIHVHTFDKNDLTEGLQMALLTQKENIHMSYW
jgi:hypothetical protein